MEDESKSFEQVAKEAVENANMGEAMQRTFTNNPLAKMASVTGQAITSLAYAKRDLEDARARGDTDMMRFSQAFREAEANLNRAVGAHVDAIIAMERGQVIPNALEGL